MTKSQDKGKSIFDPSWIDAQAGRTISETDRVRARLILRTYQSERSMTFIAAMLAEHAHAGVVNSKNGEDYIEHPRRIVRRLGKRGYDPVRIALGWLHDVVEDTDLTLDEVMAAFEVSVHSLFPQDEVDRLRAGLDAISMRKGETREEYYARLKQNEDAMAVKEDDVNDNTDPARVAELSEADRIRLDAKYKKTRAVLGFADPHR